MPKENQPGVSRAVQAIADERQRQISSEGYSAYRDDGYTRNELADAAACYATLAGCKGSMTSLWPWGQEAFKLGTDRRRDLIKAGALIVAEIERIDRLSLIRREIVRRDDMGFWTHTAWPQDGDENAIQKGWFADNGLEYYMVEMESDGPEELNQQWLDSGLIDCTPWEPSAPPGDGWFVFSIHDTEDGPVCVWVRHKVSP